MKRKLRHPIRAIREPFGTAGLIVAMIALVAALGGTAFAAAKLNSTQKKEVEKIAKKYAGKPGAVGANGTNGSPGAAGKDGTNGTNGAPGASVASSTEPPGANCEKGGSKFVAGASTTYACNGKPGLSGFTKTLPSGETETGTWSVSGDPMNVGFPFEGLLAPISFNIPLASAPAPIFIGVEAGEGEPNEAPAIENGECSGTVAAPGAEEGKLCIFVFNGNLTVNLRALPTAIIYDPGTGNGGVANPAGATVFVLAEDGSEPLSAIGTWAVTAE